eukprot:gene15552-17137_t
MDSNKGVNSYTDEVEPPATDSVINSYWEENSASGSNRATNRKDGYNDGGNLNPQGGSSPETVCLKTRDNILRIATWNVRTLYQDGNIENLIQEVEEMRLDITGIAEVRWTDAGIMAKDDYTIMYSGGEEHRNGVAFIINKNVKRSLLGFWPISERVAVMKLEGKPFNIALIQVYTPTSDYSDEDIDIFYESIQKAIKHAKSDDIMFVMGDMNAKVGSKRYGSIVGSYGLGEINPRGERLIEFCDRNNLAIMNTWFQQPRRRLYTWSSPDGVTRNQIDYIMVRQRFRNCVQQVKTYPGADVGSDHNPVVMRVKIKLKKIQKPKIMPRYDMNLLRDGTIRERFGVAVRNMYESFNVECDTKQSVEGAIDQKWCNIRDSMKKTTEELILRKENKAKQPWMKDHILQLMTERKQNKCNESKYREFNKKIKVACKKAKEEWLDERCREIEELDKIGRTRQMYDKVKELTSGKKMGVYQSGINDKNGEALFDKEDIKKRWVEYIGELYDDDQGDIPTVSNLEGPCILHSEVEQAIKELKCGKAGDKLEQVQKFVYLGHMITEDGKCETEIKRRIEIARSAINQMKALIVSGKISVKVRIRLAKCYIWSTLMYGAEAWTISKVMQTKLEAFEMWIYRRIMKVPWTAKKSNVEVLTLVNERRKLMGMIKERKLKYLGHILRHPCLGKELCEGMVNGKRGRGRPRLK